MGEQKMLTPDGLDAALDGMYDMVTRRAEEAEAIVRGHIAALEAEVLQAKADASEYRRAMHEVSTSRDAADARTEEVEAKLEATREDAEKYRQERDAALADRDRHAQTADVWRTRVHEAAEALSDVLPGEVGRLDLTARIAALKDELETIRPFEALHADLSAQLREAWEATGVSGTVKGLTTLADVVRVTKADLTEALARLKPSGQVAEDERKVRVVLDNVHAGAMTTSVMAADARDAHARLAAKAQGYEAISAALSDNFGTDGEPLSRVKELLKSEEEARSEARAEKEERHRAEAERAAAVADNAAWRMAALAIAPAVAVLARAPEVAPDIRSVLLAAEAAFLVNASAPHPGAALLERHRQEVADAIAKERAYRDQRIKECEVRARNEGMEKAAREVENHALAASPRIAARIRSMKEPEQ